MNTNQGKETMRKEENTMKDLFKEVISIATLIAENVYNLEIDYALEDEQVTFICRGNHFEVVVNELGYAFIDIDSFEFLCKRDELIEQEFYQLFSYHINYWLREIRRHEVLYVS